MPSYKLTYFEFPGRAEPIRLAFHIAGIPFTEERFTWEEFFPKRHQYPLGQLPVLTIDGKDVIPHESAILKYVGFQTGLFPMSDKEEAMKTDVAIGVANDLMFFNLIFVTPDFPGKDLPLKMAIEKQIPDALKQVEKYLSGLGTPYVSGSKLTIGDLKLYSVIRGYKSGNFKGLPANIVDNYPHINKHFALVDGHEKVASWTNANPLKF